MRNTLTIITLAVVALLTSCATVQIPATEVKAKAQNKIYVLQDTETVSKIRSVGTTVFNNKTQEVDFGNIDIANILVQRLRSRGYKAEVTTVKKGLYISLSPIAPYGNEFMTGGGLFQRIFVGIKPNAIAHSNYIPTLIDSDTKKMNSPSLGTINGSYFQKKTSYNDNLKNWSNFTPAQKASMKADLKQVLTNNSDKIIEALGL